MLRLVGIRLLVLPLLLLLLAPTRAAAQDDPDEIPLGDVARNLRKSDPPAQTVIDDDNLPQVMEQADLHHAFGSGMTFLMSGNKRGFQMATPDVTCSLSFSASLKSLLSRQYDQMDLPPAELSKIEGKAVVEGDALTIPIFNGTQWHLSELAVAFTVISKQKGSGDSASPQDEAFDSFQQVRPEKKPDTTIIYRMRAAAAPWADTVFSAPLNLELAPDEEWHWAIVQARGYPPDINVIKPANSVGSVPASGQTSIPEVPDRSERTMSNPLVPTSP
jgi:hypothetical protein